MPGVHSSFDLIPPTGGWATPYNEYDMDEICAGDDDYTKWYPTNKLSASPCHSNYIRRTEEKENNDGNDN